MPFVIISGEPTDELVTHYPDIWNEWKNSDKLSFKTSGTTGAPKTVFFSKEQIEISVKLTATFFDLSAGSKIFSALPLQFVAGKMMVFRALVMKWDLFYEEPTSHPLHTIGDLEFDFAAFTPMQAMGAIEKLHHIKKIILGGSPVQRKLIQELQSRKIEAYETFGMTETLTHCAVRKISPTEDDFFGLLPGFEMISHSGDELWLKTPFHKEILKTNDIVEPFECGFRWKGRKDLVINSGGIKIHPEEIENYLMEYLPPNSFYITSKKDELLGEKVIFIGEKRIQNVVSENIFYKLEKYHIPKDVHFVNKLPKTTSGKIIRKSWEELQSYLD